LWGTAPRCDFLFASLSFSSFLERYYCDLLCRIRKEPREQAYQIAPRKVPCLPNDLHRAIGRDLMGQAMWAPGILVNLDLDLDLDLDLKD
jgi:hypothetical protein